MVLASISPAPATLIIAETGVREWLVWVLFALGFLLAVGPLLFVFLTRDTPSRDWLTKTRQILKWGQFDFELSLLTFLVLAGLAVSVWSFTTFVTSQPITELRESLSKLQGQNDLLREEVQKAQLLTLTVYLNIPGQVLDPKEFDSLQCRYKISGQEWKVGQKTAGKSDHDIGCVITDISRGNIIDRLNVEQLTIGGPQIIGFVENIHALEPNFDLRRP